MKLEEYRNQGKLGRSQWIGGGFGLGGALKGAAIAKVLNAGKEYLDALEML